ncbi:MAG: hypothetical protein ACR2P5_03415 [Gammaproteobacteria bacterium]
MRRTAKNRFFPPSGVFCPVRALFPRAGRRPNSPESAPPRYNTPPLL